MAAERAIVQTTSMPVPTTTVQVFNVQLRSALAISQILKGTKNATKRHPIAEYRKASSMKIQAADIPHFAVLQAGATSARHALAWIARAKTLIIKG